jgi:L-fucose isomerase-like protein
VSKLKEQEIIIMNRKTTFALYFGNRGFFPESLIEGARREIIRAVESCGCDYILPPEGLTRYGAVELTEDGRKYATWLKKNEGSFDGVILSLPNFGDENGAVAALRDAKVPILIQAFPDEIGKMGFESRRDAFCGKFSIMDMFTQYNIPYTVMEPHVVHPADKLFHSQLQDFAAICRMVNGMKRFTIGAIGARTTAFKTVRFDEVALEKYGITVETYDLSELFYRVEQYDPKHEKMTAKRDRLLDYTDFSKVPEDKINTLCAISVAIDDMIEENHLDCVAIRCWTEMQTITGVAPCVLLSELNDRGIVAACELDVGNAIPMYALHLASQKPAMCLDWNNNYGEDPDKCILFHCGPIAQSLMTAKGEVIDHKMFAKAGGAGCGWGCNVGRIANFPITFASTKTENGKLVAYLGEGEFTNDEIEPDFFGCGGVCEVHNLQRKLLRIGRGGFRHHVSASPGRFQEAVREAFSVYLNYEIYEIE